MGIEQYFGKINGELHYVSKVETKDEFGGVEYEYSIGDSFSGVVIQTKTQQYVAAQKRGEIDEGYTLVVPTDVELKDNDIIMVEAFNGKPRMFLKVDTFPAYNPPSSSFSGWKYYNVSTFKLEYDIIE